MGDRPETCGECARWKWTPRPNTTQTVGYDTLGHCHKLGKVAYWDDIACEHGEKGKASG